MVELNFVFFFFIIGKIYLFWIYCGRLFILEVFNGLEDFNVDKFIGILFMIIKDIVMYFVKYKIIKIVFYAFF